MEKQRPVGKGGSSGAVRNEMERLQGAAELQGDAAHKGERQRCKSSKMRSGGFKRIAQRVQRAQQHEHSDYSDHNTVK